MTEEPKMAYIMREPCGCVVFVSSDQPYMRKNNAREIAAGLRDGLTVERVTSDWVRAHGLQRCPTHEAEAQQLKLGAHAEALQKERDADECAHPTGE